MDPAVIISGYSRSNSLSRLLDSISNAKYPHKNIEIVISLDGGASKEVLAVAKRFKFSNGNVTVVTRDNNVGLRKHILWCGDQSLKYGSVIVLEDDIVVDPYFYLYASAALDFYEGSQNIAGIALYAPHYNEYIGLPFEPFWAGHSSYFMCVPCSWGQAWSATQWNEFRNWYKYSTCRDVNDCELLPEAVKKWPESSWKKYFAAYMVNLSKYFVYPYVAYSTNCSDTGGKHVRQQSNEFQVPMPHPERVYEPPHFQRLKEDSIRYDSFMEPELYRELSAYGMEPSEIEVDFYGSKPLSVLMKKKFCLTSKSPVEAIKSFPLRFRPIERNLSYSNNDPKAGPLYLCLSKSIRPETVLRQQTCYYKFFEYYFFFPLSTKHIFSLLLYIFKKIRTFIRFSRILQKFSHKK